MPDLRERKDIEDALKEFYQEAFEDKLLGPIFKDIAQLDLNTHLPLIADFWESVLFSHSSYSRNVLEPHLALHKIFPLEKKHFDRWLLLFEKNLRQKFEGPNCERAVQRAQSIATVMQIKIAQVH